MTFQNQLNMQIATHNHLIPMKHFLMYNKHKLISPKSKISKPSAKLNYSSSNPSSNDKPLMTQNDISPVKQIIKTHQTNLPFDRSRHSSRNQTERNAKTHYNLRQQSRKDNRLFTPSKL